jgi:hypothetical protein
MLDPLGPFLNPDHTIDRPNSSAARNFLGNQNSRPIFPHSPASILLSRSSYIAISGIASLKSRLNIHRIGPDRMSVCE